MKASLLGTILLLTGFNTQTRHVYHAYEAGIVQLNAEEWVYRKPQPTDLTISLNGKIISISNPKKSYFTLDAQKPIVGYDKSELFYRGTDNTGNRCKVCVKSYPKSLGKKRITFYFEPPKSSTYYNVTEVLK